MEDENLKFEDFLSDESFPEALVRFQKEKNLTDEECAGQADISVKSWQFYKKGKRHPISNTVLLIAIVLELNVEETEYLLHTAGYHFEENNCTDKIVRKCIEKKEYNLDMIYKMLETMGQSPLNKRRVQKSPVQMLSIARKMKKDNSQ